MEAPDRIYINGFSAFATEPVKNGIEYIRKDALLEWLEQELTQRRQWFERYEDGEDLHACNEITKLIEKINSM